MTEAELAEYRAALSQRMDDLETKLKENTTTTKRVEENTKELVEILSSWKGAMKVIDFLGSLAKPLAAIVGLGAAYLAWRSGKP